MRLSDLADTIVCLAGDDASYGQSSMLTASVDGIAPDEGVARRTLQALRLIAANHRLVYLPTHDPESGRRLETLEPANVSG